MSQHPDPGPGPVGSALGPGAARGAGRPAERGPLPRPSLESAPFWEFCRKGELRLQQCHACKKFWFPPAVFCQECWSDDWSWERVSGRGHIHSFVVFRRAYHPAFKERLPYAVAVVEVAEGPRLTTMLVHADVQAIRVGQPVQVVFTPVTEDVSLPLFRPMGLVRDCLRGALGEP